MDNGCVNIKLGRWMDEWKMDRQTDRQTWV